MLIESRRARVVRHRAWASEVEHSDARQAAPRGNKNGIFPEMSEGYTILSRLRPVAMGAVMSLLAACANLAEQPTDAATADPIEPFNRYVFELNRFGDEFAAKPLAMMYRSLVPGAARESVSNALVNLRLPWTAVNDVMQGEFGRAGQAAARFALNSTFGFFGLFDMAKDVGFQHHDEDFGQTLAAWGASGDPYLMLPVFGPSSPRDAIGQFIDGAVDPVTTIAQGGYGWGRGNGFTGTRAALGFLSGRERTLEALAELERGQDYYAAVRSAYRQRRAAEIRNEQINDRTIPPRWRFGADMD